MTSSEMKSFIDNLIKQRHSFSITCHHAGNGQDELKVEFTLKLKSNERISIDTLEK